MNTKTSAITPGEDTYPGPYERNIIRIAQEWFSAALAKAALEGAGERPSDPVQVDEDNPQLLLLCMTPRSGSTALSAALSASNALGRGGERLNRNNSTLNNLIAERNPCSLRELLDQVIVSGRTPNGLSQIKCDLPQILPFLLDRDCFRLLRNARFVYLTREDILGQAISRYRGFQAGVWHSNTEAGRSGAVAPYDYDGINKQVKFILEMMSAYERAFAVLALRPLRITFEQLSADPGEVLKRVAALMNTELPPGLSLEDGGYRRVSDSNNDDLRMKYLADSQELLGFA